MVACVIWDHVVVGSSPATQTKKYLQFFFIYELIFAFLGVIMTLDDDAGVAQW